MIVSFVPPDPGLHLFVDEAGDFGTKLPGSKTTKRHRNWFVLGGVAVQTKDKKNLKSWCSEISSACGVFEGQPLHFRELKDDNKLKACRLIARLPIWAFVYCSNKVNMRGYENEVAARVSNEKNWFYNSSVKYLLERATEFGHEWNRSNQLGGKHLELVVGEREDVSISKLKVYLDSELQRVRSGTAYHYARPMKWEVLNSSLMSGDDARSNPGLQLADVVASAFYCAIEDDGHSINYDVEPAKALFPVVWDGSVDQTGRQFYEDHGLTVFPPNSWIKLNDRQHELCRFFNFDLRARWLAGPPKTKSKRQ